jgi:DNA/RNA-binding domain of Phe-tRNA-synthetase-like protein
VADFSYEIATDIFRLFPGYRLGVAVFRNVENTRANPDLTALLREAENRVRTVVDGNVAEHPVVAAWRGAYRRFGAKPSEHRSSIEALLRRVLKPESLPAINPLVDIGNVVSLQKFMPAGVHPIRHANTCVALRQAHAGDLFLATESAAPEQVTPGEVVLADQNDVLTRRWTWRQSLVTRTETSSRNVFFNVDGLESAGAERVEDALSDIVRLVGRFCGGEVVYQGVLARESPRFKASLG